MGLHKDAEGLQRDGAWRSTAPRQQLLEEAQAVSVDRSIVLYREELDELAKDPHLRAFGRARSEMRGDLARTLTVPLGPGMPHVEDTLKTR
jgi:hypothetical protein